MNGGCYHEASPPGTARCPRRRDSRHAELQRGWLKDAINYHLTSKVLVLPPRINYILTK